MQPNKFNANGLKGWQPTVRNRCVRSQSNFARHEWRHSFNLRYAGVWNSALPISGGSMNARNEHFGSDESIEF